MQKTRVSKIFLSFFFSIIIGYTCNAQSTHQNLASLSNTNNTVSKDLFSHLFGKKHEAYRASHHSNEIWTRVRQRFQFNSPAQAPLFQRHVREYAHSQDYINKLVRNATPYIYYILEEVEKRGMPSEIALLPMIESDFNPHTISHKGAVGLWQLMPSLGRLYGLKQNAWYDGRKDIYESTKVALDHLQYLHQRFNGNWLLALAAYNSGEARVLNAIKKNKSAKKATDFWSLKLPKETTHFVPKLLALVAIINSPKQYGVVLPHIANQPVFARINTGKPIDMMHAAKIVEVSETQLRKLNPGFHKKAMHPSGPFNLVVPISHANNLKMKMNKLSSSATVNTAYSLPSTNKRFHVVKPGDSIPKISQKYNVKISTLLAYNQLKANTIIHPGQKIIISSN